VTPHVPRQSAEAPDRTLILGLDGAGRIVDHDRLAVGLINGVRESLLGVEFASLIADPLQAESFGKHLDAVRSGRDVTIVINVNTAWTGRAEAVITLQPVSSSTGLVARMIVRIASPAEGRFADAQVMQHALLDAPISRTGGGLGINEVAPALTGVVVPHFCNVGGLLVRESLFTDDELAGAPRDGSLLLRRMTVKTENRDQRWSAGFPAGELLCYPSDSLYSQCIASREPVIEALVTDERGPRVARAWQQRPVVAELLTEASLLFLPLVSRRVVLGVLVCIRKPGYRRFGADDVRIGEEFAERAAAFIDNARHYSRERATALTLQRSLTRVHLALADVAGAATLVQEIDEALRRQPSPETPAGEPKTLRDRLAEARGPGAHGAATLTAAELRLLPLLSTHLTFPEIAAELFLSYNTIKSQAMSVYRKLGASSRNQAVAQARELGLIETGAGPFTFSGR
jgi:DNA-binding CsgD family transcriptional regulator/GAF domain-containing protein